MGYTLTYYMQKYLTWEWSFYVQAIAILPCVGCFIITPSQYINIQYAVQFKKECIKRAEKKVLNKEDESPVDVESNDDISIEEETQKSHGLNSTSALEPSQEEPTLRENLENLVGNKEFWLICFSLTGLFFVVTGIQYWLPTYLKVVYKLSEDQAAILYTTTSITGPVGGVIMGGIITTYFGGYNTYKSHRLQQFIGICAVACALPIPFVDFSVFAWLMWLLLFFGGFLLPQVTGIMLNTVEEKKRTSANSIASLCYNLMGYLPAPSFYGMVSAITNNPVSRVPMACLLYSTLVSISMLIIGINAKLAREKTQSKIITYKIAAGTGETNHDQMSESKLREQEMIENPRGSTQIDTDSLLGTPEQPQYLPTRFDTKSSQSKPVKYGLSPA